MEAVGASGGSGHYLLGQKPIGQLSKRRHIVLFGIRLSAGKGARIPNLCDHANLVEVFAPRKDLEAHVRGSLLRWV
ncbi:hypothetical protein PsorP6_000203 [Peronosclerospora sorghi]|uniref:Uncharacterized protein n=1 Tax=Peronosclerospora sorghi TaxID=230839 RepID=A0ACC0WVR1_9STRA|nr:hypothetical protein PsorP6_000203 [Peronosclerospora sorghi]